MRRIQRLIEIAAVTLSLASLAGASTISSITSNFNGISAAGGDLIWFTGVLMLNGSVPGNAPVDIFVNGLGIASPYFNIPAPSGEVTFSPGATLASTTYSDSGWDTITPFGASGNTFLEAVEYQAPAGGLPGGVSPVTWTAGFSTGTPAISLNWQWAPAVYTSFSPDYNALGVQPANDNHASPYGTSDHAGTPENYTSYVVGGARGGGGSNFTGSLSATANVIPGGSPTPQLSYFLPLAGLLIVAGWQRRRG
jgi:hypothetical protein